MKQFIKCTFICMPLLVSSESQPPSIPSFTYLTKTNDGHDMADDGDGMTDIDSSSDEEFSGIIIIISVHGWL